MPQDFLPSDDTGLLRGSVQTATGTSFDQVSVYTRQVMKVVQDDPNVADVQGDEGGDMNISLKPLSQRPLSADQVTTELRRKLRNIPGTAITFNNPPIIRVGGRFARSSYQYTLQGLDLPELQQASQELVQALQDDPTFVGVNSDQDMVSPSVRVAIDRGRAAALGVTPDEIQSTLGLAFGGQQVSQIYATTDQYQVILELLPEYPAGRHRAVAALPAGDRRGDGAADRRDPDQPPHHAALSSTMPARYRRSPCPSTWRPARR